MNILTYSSILQDLLIIGVVSGLEVGVLHQLLPLDLLKQPVELLNIPELHPLHLDVECDDVLLRVVIDAYLRLEYSLRGVMAQVEVLLGHVQSHLLELVEVGYVLGVVVLLLVQHY